MEYIAEYSYSSRITLMAVMRRKIGFYFQKLYSLTIIFSCSYQNNFFSYNSKTQKKIYSLEKENTGSMKLFSDCWKGF